VDRRKTRRQWGELVAEDINKQVFTVVIYLKTGGTITMETSVPEEFISSLVGHMDAFCSRSIFRSRGSTIRLSTIPIVVIPIDHINFFTLVEKPPNPPHEKHAITI